MDKTSILRMAMGAIEERVDYEMGHVMDNILDVNTPASKKRKLTLTVEFTPDSERQTIAVSVTAKTTLVPTNPINTSLYVTGDPMTGEAQVVEMVPQVPGQTSMDGDIQDSPKILNIKQA